MAKKLLATQQTRSAIQCPRLVDTDVRTLECPLRMAGCGWTAWARRKSLFNINHITNNYYANNVIFIAPLPQSNISFCIINIIIWLAGSTVDRNISLLNLRKQ